ncbi:fatty acid oxidation complex subunit alpha FadB [Noviherbaspirillum pedocola]|uniref:enoyl-CoA hydratase n=1 Tax=Noviherbaspirillum pedocola TaxID=2801341 RepID=A0A934T2X6_9BURK|nr:fatty acid oxidation complex subunit alpha FadB [Noviherbaspirillum pedocola]MBK4738722.1 fatty acid oxidation complex subunit alpha FadB [Noviherbaspirillum pedocola]
MYLGQTITVTALAEGFVELCFNRQGASINKMDRLMSRELGEATRAIAAMPELRGVLMSSAKDVFIVGADITEFHELFKAPPEKLKAENNWSNQPITAFEDLPIPTVAAINGYALGGGLEIALSAVYRVMSNTAQVGVPEVNLGLFPGAGGTVRLPRVASVQTAIDWVSSGKPSKAEAALRAGVVDEICAPEKLREVSLGLLRRAADGQIDWQAQRRRKLEPVPLPAAEVAAVFQASREKIAATAPKHQPAATVAVDMMAHAVLLDRAGARRLECEAFGAVAKSQAADSLVQLFHNDQALKKLFRAHAKQARPVKQAAVLGAGIMGGGISYTSALRGVPVRMKDIQPTQLELGSKEALKQLARQVKAGRLTQDKANAVMASITPQLDFAGFNEVDVVIEAIVENISIKRRVLAEVEEVTNKDAVIASNTSSLRIDDMAQALRRPQNFVGMHFFNPVPVMSLVEVIKGSATSEEVVSTAVGYAVAMGKTPIVVKDCPGFLVNRILTAYVRAFMELVAEGVDYLLIDHVMEEFGWPMGPAYLEDVVGMDTGSHVSDVISAGYPERMPPLARDALRLMVEHERYGQKNGIGFYRYELDPAGKPRKHVAEDTAALLATIQPHGRCELSHTEIVERMMLPLMVEAAHALEEEVVATPAELDMALLLGIGFPKYLGGALKYADWLGLEAVVRRCDHYAHLGKHYQATTRMRTMASNGSRYYGAP